VTEAKGGEESRHGDDGSDGKVDFAGREDEDRAKAMRAIGVTCEMIEVAFWAVRKPLSPIVIAKKAKTRANPR
jgi:hypothetical protein